MPDASELARYYPADYWFPAGGTAAARLEEAYRRLVLRDHVGFVRTALGDAGIGGPVLDVGCGGALFGRMLAESGVRVLGLDLSQQAAKVAWRVNGVPVACGLLTDMPMRPESFAAVTMFHVLEHLHDPVEYVHAAMTLLKPGGRLVVQVPNIDCWQFAMFGSAWNGLDIPRHLFDFRASDVRSLLEHCGLTVVREKHFSLRDNPAGLASTVAPGLDPMARRVRGVRESEARRIVHDLAYLGLVIAAVPLTIIESACGAGSSVMLDARKPA